jgi:hypothetical protein
MVSVRGFETFGGQTPPDERCVVLEAFELFSLAEETVAYPMGSRGKRCSRVVDV